MCPRDPKATPNIRLSDDYNITSVVKFLSKFWYFSQVSVKADFHPTITIHSLEFAFLQRVRSAITQQTMVNIKPLHILQRCFKMLKILIPIENSCIFIPKFRVFRHIYMDFICKDIFTIVVWAYLPADKYANMKSGQIHWNILNMGMNMQESTIGLNIICSGGV